jgi:nucleoside-diphosphate-sugar epimerase
MPFRSSNRLIIWGAGELGGRVAAHWIRAGGEVVAFTRTPGRHGQLQSLGIEAHTGAPIELLRPEDRLLLALPGHENQQAAVAQLVELQPPRRVVFISSTGYYSAPSGMVDEATPPGLEERAQAIAAVESAFQDWAGDRGVILRCGGLYRPGRGPLSSLQRRGKAPLGPPDRTLALIHYDDAALATFHALRREEVEPVYLAVTPPCPTRREFYTAASAVLGLPMPAFTDPLHLAPADYDVSHLRRDLLPAPQYPDWTAALER